MSTGSEEMSEARRQIKELHDMVSGTCAYRLVSVRQGLEFFYDVGSEEQVEHLVRLLQHDIPHMNDMLARMIWMLEKA